MKIKYSCNHLFGLLIFWFSTCTQATQFPCYDAVINKYGICSTPIISDFQVKYYNWPGVLLAWPGTNLPARYGSFDEAMAGYNERFIPSSSSHCAITGPVTKSPLTTYYWDFGVINYYIFVSPCGGDNPVVVGFRPWSCPAGFQQFTSTNTKPITPSSNNHFPCFKPDAKIYGGSCVGDPIKVFENSVIEREDDYIIKSSRLSFSRFYRSFGASIDKPYIGNNWSATFFDTLRRASFNQPYVSLLRHTNESHFFSKSGSMQWIAQNFDNDILVELIDSSGSTSGWLYRDDTSKSILVFDASEFLRRETFIGGNQLTYAYSDAATLTSIAPSPGFLISVTDGFGRVLKISYDEFGYIKSVTDPSGEIISYAYDTPALNTALRDLRSVTYQDGAQKSYSYLAPASSTNPNTIDFSKAGQLSKIFDELGNKYSSFEYSNDGSRSYATSSEQAGGVNRYAIDVFNASIMQSGVVDPLGTRRTYFGLPTAGSLQQKIFEVGRSQSGGSGCSASAESLALDVNGNLGRLDNFNGERTCYANSISRNLETARIEGLANTIDCSTITPDNAALPAGSRKTSTQWHPDWRLAIRIAEPGKITTNVYNGQPDPFNGNAIASCAPASALLPDGHPIAVLCKQVEQSTTDPDGHLGFAAPLQISVPSRQSSWTYNAFGQILTAQGPRTDITDRTTYSYYTDTTSDHTLGDLQSVTNSQGKTTQYPLYNKHGQVLRTIDSNGAVTDNTYDLRQRLLSTTVGGLKTSYVYDAAGQLKKVTLPDATTLTYSYDAAHRLVQETDAEGRTTSYTLDNAGNRVQEQVKNPSGGIIRNVTRVFDALGRLQSVTGASE